MSDYDKEHPTLGPLTRKLVEVESKIKKLDSEIRFHPWYVSWYMSRLKEKEETLKDLYVDQKKIEDLLEQIVRKHNLPTAYKGL